MGPLKPPLHWTLPVTLPWEKAPTLSKERNRTSTQHGGATPTWAQTPPEKALPLRWGPRARAGREMGVLGLQPPHQEIAAPLSFLRGLDIRTYYCVSLGPVAVVAGCAVRCNVLGKESSRRKWDPHTGQSPELVFQGVQISRRSRIRTSVRWEYDTSQKVQRSIQSSDKPDCAPICTNQGSVPALSSTPPCPLS